MTATSSDSNSIAAKRYVPKTASITVTVDSSKASQTILVSDGGSGKFGLRDLPLSRLPIAIGKMFKASSNLNISYSITSDPSKVINLTKSVLSGPKAQLVINQAGAGKFSGFGSDKEVSFEITATQAGDNSTTPHSRSLGLLRLRSLPSPYSSRKESRMPDMTVSRMMLSPGLLQNVEYQGRRHSPCSIVIPTTPTETVFPTYWNAPLAGFTRQGLKEAKPTSIDKK